MARHDQQHITITHRDGVAHEFAGDNYRLITGPMGIRWVLDDTGQRVWSDPFIQQGGPAEVVITHPRPDYTPVLTSDQAMGMAAPTIPPALLAD